MSHEHYQALNAVLLNLDEARRGVPVVSLRFPFSFFDRVSFCLVNAWSHLPISFVSLRTITSFQLPKFSYAHARNRQRNLRSLLKKSLVHLGEWRHLSAGFGTCDCRWQPCCRDTICSIFHAMTGTLPTCSAAVNKSCECSAAHGLCGSRMCFPQ